jgi:hypothetical protein
MSVIPIKSETTGYRILVKAGDEELARQEAVKAAISAEAARISAIAASDSEQVAIEKAAQSLEDAASALASKQDAEIAATASEGFASDSGISATASEAAKVLSEEAKGISIEEAGKSSTSAGQSAESAAAAAASSALITNKAEVNITNEGNILRADGTLFKSISEVELLKSKQIFRRSPLSAETDTAQIIHWDTSFGKPNQNPYTTSDSGAAYTILSGTGNLQISNNKLSLTNNNDIISIPTNGVGSIKFTSWLRVQPGNRTLRLLIGKNANNYIVYGLDFNNITVKAVIDGVSTTLYSTSLNIFRDSPQLNFYAIDLYGDISLTLFQASINEPYTNLGLYVHSSVFTSLRLTVDLTAYMSTFAKKQDIAFCGFSAIGNSNPISSWIIKSISP